MFFDEVIKFIHDDKLLIFYKKRPFQYAIIPHTVRSELVVRVSPTPRNFFSPNTDSIFFCVIIYFSCILFLPIPPSHMPYTFLYSRHSKTEYNLYFAKILPLIYFRLFFILLQFYNIQLSVTFYSILLGYNTAKKTETPVSYRSSRFILTESFVSIMTNFPILFASFPFPR